MIQRLVFCAIVVFSTSIFAQTNFTFRDVTRQAGLQPAIEKAKAHGSAWGDVDGDGFIDLYFGTFDTGESKPNMLFRNMRGKFELVESKPLRISSRTTGVVFADFDNDGDNDLYVGSMPAAPDSKLAKRNGRPLKGCTLFRNDGGAFTDVSADNAACPTDFGGRSASVLDYDGDGLLDLLVGEDPNAGYNGSKSKTTRLFRNEGNLKFKQVKLPISTPGLGVAAADVNNDTWPDIFIACSEGGNRLLLNDGKGNFNEDETNRKIVAWPEATGDNMVCGVAFGDMNRDGLLDLVLGQHFDSPWRKPVTNRVFLHRGISSGDVKYDEVTGDIGIEPLGIKSPHVEFRDFDNDGWPDLFTSVVYFRDDVPHPAIFKHRGVKKGMPRFELGRRVNDFPTEEDKAIGRSGTFFDKMIADHKVLYTATAPTGDFNNDGKIDIFLGSWWVEQSSLLLQNETKVGNWLQITPVLNADFGERAAIGARVSIYPVGKAGQPDELLGCQEVAVGFGYASGQTPQLHFGLGEAKAVDVEVRFPHGGKIIQQRNVAANQRISIASP